MLKPIGSTGTPPVTIVVLNFNGYEHLEYCLPSVCATNYANLQVLVVDNGSTDGSAEMTEARFPSVMVIRNSRNLGWSGGNNVGIRHALAAGVKYVVLANNDIRVDPRWIGVAVEALEADPRIGVAGFDVMEPSSKSSDHDAGFTAAQAKWAGCELSAPSYIGGMAMMIRSEAFERIGLMDEEFFAYGEENDFQIRARKAGYTVVATNVPVWHYGGGSFGKVPLMAAFLQTRNNIRLLIKHSSPLALLKAGVWHIVRRTLRRAELQDSPVERRLRGPDRMMAMRILMWALAWNVLRLPNTLRARRAHDGLAAAANEMWPR